MLTLNRDYRFDPKWTYGLPGNLSNAAFRSDQDRPDQDMLSLLYRTSRPFDYCQGQSNRKSCLLSRSEF